MIVYDGIKEVVDDNDHMVVAKAIIDLTRGYEGLDSIISIIVNDKTKVVLVTADHELAVFVLFANGDDYCTDGCSYLDGDRTIRIGEFAVAVPKRAFTKVVDALEYCFVVIRRGRVDEDDIVRQYRYNERLRDYPVPFKAEKSKRRRPVNKIIHITNELRNDVIKALEYIENAAKDGNNIDYDDAIQVGLLNGGRVDVKKDKYAFSYYPGSNEVWTFEVAGLELSAIAVGSKKTLKIDFYG